MYKIFVGKLGYMICCYRYTAFKKSTAPPEKFENPGYAAAYPGKITFYSSIFVMEFTVTARVEALCSNADMAGGRTPRTPRTMSMLLKAMMKR